MNLASVALRAVVEALSQDEEAARGALMALLAPHAPTVAHRDHKPPNTTKRPAARRRVARPARPVPAAPEVEDVEPGAEAAALVRAIEARHGLDVACERFGLNREVLRRWRGGAPCSARSLERLRLAAETAPYSRAPEGQEVDAAPEAALRLDPTT